MWLLLLSLFAIESIQSASIGYPYHSLWTYNPLKTDSIHGYVRYLDSNGGIVGYNSPQPVFAVRQIKYVNGAAPALDTFAIKNSEETIKAREAYLQTASLQQYQSLKSDIDALKAEGKEPSAEKLLKLQKLEKIALTSDFSLIADLPELKSTLQDLETSIRESVPHSSSQQVSAARIQGETKTYVDNVNIPLEAIQETPEQKQARENHLRIYNEQIAHLKQLELEHEKYVQEASAKLNTEPTQKEDKPIEKQVDNAKALEEFERAQQEHFRLWNEAKLRAKQTENKAQKQQIATSINDENIYKPKQTIPKAQNPEIEKLQHTAEHSKQFDEQSLKTEVSIAKHKQQFNENANLKHTQVQRSEDEQEVVIQKQDIQPNSEEENSKTYSKSHIPSAGSPASSNYRAEQFLVEETPEVKKAREEHLRLVHEANLRAQFVEQEESKYKYESQTPILKSQNEHQQLTYYPETSHNLAQISKERQAFKDENEKGIILPSQLAQQQSSDAQFIAETSEVQRAREEHLRLFNSIKSHSEKQQAKENGKTFPQPASQQQTIIDFSMEEERLLELERLREAERLQKEQQLLVLERLRETKRLDEEKHQMEAELKSLRLEEEQRLEMERLLEDKRLQQEKEEMRKLQAGEYEEIIIQSDAYNQQAQSGITSNANVEQTRNQENSKNLEQQFQHYAVNPFLKDGQISIEHIKTLEHSVPQQSSLLKTIPSNNYQHNTFNPAQHSSGGKQQYIKYNYQDAATSQPADTAAALIALEKATNDHFRAHELALEQLRLARIHDPTIKDCN